MDENASFGEQFLEEVRQLTGSNPLDYATTQRVKGMGREELIELLRQNAGATYADIQRLRKAEDPRELAQYLVEAQRRSAQAVGVSASLWALMFLIN